MLGAFITSILLPGIPLVCREKHRHKMVVLRSSSPSKLYYGEEQHLYILDNDADDFVYGCATLE
jgi:hypothetical protein